MRNLKLSFIGYLSVILLIIYPADQIMGDIIGSNNYSNYSPVKFLFFLYPPIFLIYLGKKRQVYVRKNIYFFFSMLIWFYISSIWAVNSAASAIEYSSKVLLLIAFTYVVIYLIGNKPVMVSKLLFYYIVTSGLVSLYIFISTDLKASGLLRISYESVGVNAIMISLGYSIVIAISYTFFHSVNLKKKIIIWLSVLIMLLVEIKGGTRSVLWGIGLSFLLTYMYLFFKQNKKNNIILILFLVAIYFTLQYLISSNYFTIELIERMFTFNQNIAQENSRIDLWVSGLKWYSSNMLGTGAGNEHYIYEGLGYSIKDEAHNVFISTLIQSNFIGLSLLCISIFSLGLNIRKINNPQYKFLAVFLFLFFIIQLFKGSFLQTRLFWQPILFLWLMIEIDNFTKNNRSIK